MAIYAEDRIRDLEEANEELHGEITRLKERRRTWRVMAVDYGTSLAEISTIIEGYDKGVYRDKLTAFDAIRKIVEDAK